MILSECVCCWWEWWRADRSNLHSMAPSHHSAIINTHTHNLPLNLTHNVAVTGRSLSLKHHHTTSVITQEIVGEIEKVLAGVAHLPLSGAVGFSGPASLPLPLIPPFLVRSWQKSVKGNDLNPSLVLDVLIRFFPSVTKSFQQLATPALLQWST